MSCTTLRENPLDERAVKISRDLTEQSCPLRFASLSSSLYVVFSLRISAGHLPAVSSALSQVGKWPRAFQDNAVEISTTTMYIHRYQQ
jgi:hypothetical protein